MRPLSPRLEALAESNTLAVSRLMASLRAAGVDVSPLAAGEPDFATPAHIVAAMSEAADRGQTRYPPVLGLPALRDAIAQHHRRRYRVAITPDRIAVTPGAKFALWAAFQAILDSADEVVLPTPTWVSYAPQIALAGGIVRKVPCHADAGWRLDLDRLAGAISSRTRAIVLCSPNNPTGVCLAQSDVDALAELALAHDLWLVCDDLYAELVFGERPFVSPLTDRPALLDRAIIVDGLSKSHAMTGWRLGYLDAPPLVIDRVGRLLGQTITGTTTFVQHGGLAALTTDYPLEPMRQAYSRRASMLTGRLPDLGWRVVPPDGGFCLLADVTATHADCDALALNLLEQAHVATVSGTAFDAPGHLRLSFACSETTLDEALRRIASFLGR